MPSIPRTLRVLLVAALAYASSPRVLRAQITFGPDGDGAAPLGLSLSGGISLGAYQAGVNFGLLELYRHAAWDDGFTDGTGIPRYRLRSVTGASAGNINTLLWALEACTDLREPGRPYRSPPPDESLFWRIWGTIGWTRIFKEKSGELAVFDRRSLIDDLAAPLLAERMRDPRLVPECSVPAGITLTRVLPDTLELQQLGIETQRVVTPFRVTVDRARGDTLVRFARMDGLGNEDQHFGMMAHLAPRGADIPFADLLQAVKASAAFPIAFAPVTLPVWYENEAEPARSLFLDGGAFDNNPVGLARNLYGAQGDSRRLDILYVNPSRYRADLARARHDTLAPPPPPGGLASVMRFVQGAVPTARQYELQLLARERAHQERVRLLRQEIQRLERYAPAAERAGAAAPGQPAVQERLLLSSRAYPVFGEHLGFFAAFLARPAREFDFYVGMYDGAHMALWHHACARHGDDRDARQACVGRALPRIIGDTLIMRDPARQIAAMLYNAEFRGDTLPVPPVPPELRDRFTVQKALFRAMGTQFTPADRDDCVDSRLIYQLLCGDGLLAVLDTLRADREAVRVIRGWAAACDSLRCDAEPVFRDLLDNPMGGGTRVLDDVIDRLRLVERGMRRDTTIPDDDYLRLVTSLQWTFHASHLRSRARLDLNPSSAPPGSWLRAVPVSFMGANLGAPGLEARWQPTWNIRSPGLVRGSLIYHYNAAPTNGGADHYLGFGGGVGWYSTWIVVSEGGVEAHHFRSIEPGAGRGGVTEVEAYGVLLAGQMRVSLRVLPFREEHGMLHGPRGWSVTAGLSDPMGLAFWLNRFLGGG